MLGAYIDVPTQPVMEMSRHGFEPMTYLYLITRFILITGKNIF